MALDAAPEDWRRELKAAGGDPSWAALVALAHARCVLLEENVPEGLAVFTLPEHHRKRLRTSNPIERVLRYNRSTGSIA